MSDTTDGNRDAFLLGKIEATVSATAEDVRAIRNDVGAHAGRLIEIEKNVAAIVAERGVMVPAYLQFVQKVHDHLGIDAAWKANIEGNVHGAKSGASITGKLLYGLAGLLLMGIGLYLGHGVSVALF